MVFRSNRLYTSWNQRWMLFKAKQANFQTPTEPKRTYQSPAATNQPASNDCYLLSHTGLLLLFLPRESDARLTQGTATQVTLARAQPPRNHNDTNITPCVKRATNQSKATFSFCLLEKAPKYARHLRSYTSGALPTKDGAWGEHLGAFYRAASP